jgi:hypothetical protein
MAAVALTIAASIVTIRLTKWLLGLVTKALVAVVALCQLGLVVSLVAAAAAILALSS